MVGLFGGKKAAASKAKAKAKGARTSGASSSAKSGADVFHYFILLDTMLSTLQDGPQRACQDIGSL